jgi:hypothetical protein
MAQSRKLVALSSQATRQPWRGRFELPNALLGSSQEPWISLLSDAPHATPHTRRYDFLAPSARRPSQARSSLARSSSPSPRPLKPDPSQNLTHSHFSPRPRSALAGGGGGGGGFGLFAVSFPPPLKKKKKNSGAWGEEGGGLPSQWWPWGSSQWWQRQQLYNFSHSPPLAVPVARRRSDKEACTGPTQTFFRTPVHRKCMWVMWEMNFDQPRFAVAPPTPSPVNWSLLTEETCRDAGQRALSPRKHRL